MFEAWGRFVFRRRRLVLVEPTVAVIGAGVWGTGVFGALQSAGGFAPPHSQSQQETAKSRPTRSGGMRATSCWSTRAGIRPFGRPPTGRL